MKDKLNYKLVNVALIALIIFLLYQTGNLWTGVIGNFFKFPITDFFKSSTNLLALGGGLFCEVVVPKRL